MRLLRPNGFVGLGTSTLGREGMGRGEKADAEDGEELVGAGERGEVARGQDREETLQDELGGKVEKAGSSSCGVLGCRHGG